MTIVSFAQNGEDVVLARAFPEDHRGFYIDVGASDPVVHSVTKHFYDRGWDGINVEPAAAALASLSAARHRDLNLGVGLGAEPGRMTFYELPPGMTGCSTFSAELADQYRGEGWVAVPRVVEMTTLAALCAEHGAGRTIDFLKIDVEGNEADVLAGADFERFRPRILVVEATVPGTGLPSHDEWEPLVREASYHFTLFDGLNRFYVREEDRELADVLSVPANTLDDFLSHQCLQWREESQRAQATIERTREELRRSQAAVRDAQTELAASRAALLAKLGEQARRR
jgi:FkbM family methyltransferase